MDAGVNAYVSVGKEVGERVDTMPTTRGQMELGTKMEFRVRTRVQAPALMMRMRIVVVVKVYAAKSIIQWR